jgi:hypothetical protein
MKKIVFLLAMTLSMTAYANSSLTNALKELQGAYTEFDQSELIDRHLFISIETNAAEAKKLLKHYEVCQADKEYKRISKSKLWSEIEGQLTEASMLLSNDGEADSQFIEKLKEVKKNFLSALSESTIRICRLHESPAYSEGHETNFVQVNGKLRFVYEVGYPD